MTSVEIRRVETNKKQYLALLLLADEQEDMIDRYLERGACMCWKMTELRRSVS